MRVLAGVGQWVGRLVFSPDGRYLAAAAEPYTRGQVVQVWELLRAAEPTWSFYRGNSVRRLVFEPSGCLLVGTWHGSVLRFDRRAVDGMEDPYFNDFNPVAFSADGRAALGRPAESGRRMYLPVARYGPDGWADIWRTDIGLASPLDAGIFTGLLIDPAGERVVRVYGRGPVSGRLVETGIVGFDGVTGSRAGEWVGRLPNSFEKLLAGPGGLLVQLRKREFHAIALDRPGSEPVKRLNTSAKHFTDAAFSPDGRWLTTTSNDNLVTLWDTATWSVARQFAWDIGRLRSVAFSPDGTLCAAGSDTGRVVVWDFDN